MKPVPLSVPLSVPPSCSVLSLLLALAGTLPAQSDKIIGLERGDAVDPVKLDKINTSCTRVFDCSLAGILSVHTGNLGGTTYDSNKGREWSSGGRKIVVTKLDCGLSCEFPIPATMASITGMGINRFTKHLYTAHADGCTRVWNADISLAPCPPSLILLGGCNNAWLHAGEVITGIEYDSKAIPVQYPAGRLFQVTTLNRLCVIHPPLPVLPECVTACPEICSVNLPVCSSPPFGPAQGLTYDKTNRHLWVTDGPNLMQISEAGAGCVLALLRCCAVNTVDSNLSGLGWQPVPTPRPLGGVCSDLLRCPSGCLPLIGFEGGPAFMNPEFQVTLAQVPAGGLSIFVLGFGPATPGIPVECGLLYTPVVPTPFFLAASHQGTQTCGATASRNLGFFPPQAVGVPFTIQAVMFCLGPAGFGVGLSQALEFEIGW